MKKFKETAKGFTLVEVMVALILLTLSFMVFLQALNTGKTVRAQSELRTIQSVIMNSVENQIRARRFDEKISAPWSTVLGSESYSDSYLSFDGSNDYVDLGYANSLSISDGITVTAWVFHNSGSGHIVNQGGGWDDNGFSMFWYGSNIRIELQNNSQKTISDNTAPSNGSWHHIAFSWETNSNIIKTYINGQQGSSTPTFNGPIGQPAEKLNIGRKEQNGYYFNGIIDDVTIWNIAKSQAEIQDYMSSNPNGNEANLVGFWTMEENNGTTIVDVSNHINNGTIHGATWLSNQTPENTISLWDDIDDFHQYTINEVSEHPGFGVSVVVSYVSPASGFSTPQSNQTDFKSVTVTVSHNTLSDMTDTMIISPGL